MSSAMPLPSQAANAMFAAQTAGETGTSALRSAKTSTAARAAAQDFESVFLNSMFSQMFTNMDGDGPFGGSPAIGVWRSFLTQEYSRSFAKNGGIGIADDVYRSLMAIQEAGTH